MSGLPGTFTVVSANDLPAGPESPPTDELASAEATLAVLQTALHPIGGDDLGRRTPCSDYDIAALTDHLMGSISVLGGAAGAEFSESSTDAVDRRVIPAARSAVDAWHRRGLDGAVSLGPGETPAWIAVGILSVEFLVHGWDYAVAMGRDLEAPEPLAGYVLELSHKIITPEGRATVGFDQPVELPGDATAFEQLLAFTGRKPIGYPKP